ncbi:hypothetical protein G6661_09010 [Polynucleobacter paneuropaeus]|nr:hypothetical protein G6661_09010 [Polynucleobacter paneuropaeus]
MSEESVFFNQGGVKITDAVFTTPNGDNFPIRNISSVAVRQSNPWVKLLIGGFLTLAGLSSAAKGDTVYPFVFLVPGIILLAIWWQNYYWALFVGTAGGQQPAIKFKAKDPILREVEQAINAAILKVQGK